MCGNKCVSERERTAACGACGDGEGIKLEWFVEKVNWDRDGSGKGCSCGWELSATDRCKKKRNEHTHR